jgi:hypothetical protein
MTQGTYISESTDNLIQRAQQIMGDLPTFKNSQTYTFIPEINALAGSCYSVAIKNTITSVSSSIVTCTGSTTTTCTIPGTCPATDPTTWINMIVTFTATAAQTSVTITFQYVLNGTPTTTVITPSIVAGSNTFYAFPTNQQYPSGTTIVLYGVTIQT